jgi:glycosyltransferase involved in cell wall biosynthesis
MKSSAHNAEAVSTDGGLRTRGYQKASREGKPLVSIITVVRNAELCLDKTIRSVLSQTYDNVEYIIIDGQSSDGTLDIVRRSDAEIDYWLSEADAGIYDALNKGIALSLGELIGIIGAGDWYERDAVEKAVRAFSRSKADVVYGDVEMVDEETALSYRMRSKSDLMPRTMGSINHPTVFAKRSIYVSRLFDTRMCIAADYDLFLGLYIDGYRFEHSGGIVTHILTGGVSSSFLTTVEVFKVHQKYYGLFHAVSQFVPSALRYVFYKGRRLALRCLLSPAGFAAARSWWLRYKGRKNTEGEKPQI